MQVLVIGGAASGKSELAEDIAAKIGGKKLYIATMQPHDAECVCRIEKHRLARADKGFETLEVYRNFADIHFESAQDVVLLECVSNLLANEMYGQGGDCFTRIMAGLHSVMNCAAVSIVVSNDISRGGGSYDAQTLEYIDCLGRINAALAECADVVIEAVCGIPIFHKGGLS